MDQPLKGGHAAADPSFHLEGKAALASLQPRFGLDFRLDVADPPVQDKRQGTPFGAGAGGQVLDQFPVGGQALALGALEAAVRREVAVGGHKAPVQGVVADCLEQEAFAAAVGPYQEPESRSAVGGRLKVPQQGLDLPPAAYGHVGQADPRRHAASKGIDHGGGDPFGHLYRFCHGFTSPFTAAL